MMDSSVNGGAAPTEAKKWKKKSKKSFLQKAKKFGKRGQFGRGKQIEKDTYDYFVRVLEQMKAPFEDEEAKGVFIHNVFQQTEGEELLLCGNQLVSRVIEDLLPQSVHEIRERFMTRFSEDLRLACMDAFQSHVLEKLMKMAAKKNKNDDPSFHTFSAMWLIKVCKFVINNFGDFVFDPYASHILRTSFQCLGGVKVADELLRSKRSLGQMSKEQPTTEDGNEDIEVTQDMIATLHDASRRILEWEDKKELIGTDISSGVVQTLIVVIAKVSPKECKKFCKVIVTDCLLAKSDATEENTNDSGAPNEQEDLEQTGEDTEKLDKPTDNGDTDADMVPEAFRYQAVCRTIEVILSQAEVLPKLYQKLWKKLFSGILVKLAQHELANYTVQKLLSTCPDKEQFEEFYESELDGGIEDILASGNTGVVLSIAQACNRLKAKQNHFLVALMKSLHCYEPSQTQTMLAPLLIHMQTLETFKQDSSQEVVPPPAPTKGGAATPFVSTVHIHGSLILQELLKFNKPIKVVNSLLAMEPASLRGLLSDPKGSHVTDVFMTSTTIGEKSREGLVKSLQGEIVALACSKHGSRSVDAIWKQSSTKTKEVIAAELSKKESVLNNNNFGKFISTNCSLSLFKRAREDWNKLQKVDNKKKELFSDILEPKKRKEPVKDEEEEDKTVSSSSSPPKKKKKKAAKSYLDDL